MCGIMNEEASCFRHLRFRLRYCSSPIETLCRSHVVMYSVTLSMLLVLSLDHRSTSTIDLPSPPNRRFIETVKNLLSLRVRASAPLYFLAPFVFLKIFWRWWDSRFMIPTQSFFLLFRVRLLSQ